MIKSLKDARLTDGLPRIVAGQDWVIALSEALGELHEKVLGYADGSQIYTALDTCSEEILDILAVNLKIDWYDTSFSIEQKRSMIESCIESRRVMGTARAVKLQASAIYPGTDIKEWFEIGTTPGTFDVYMHALPKDAQLKQYLNTIEMTKNVRSHLRNIQVFLEGDLDGPDLMEGRTGPDPFGIETHYFVTYRGYFPIPEEIETKIKTKMKLPFWGASTTYNGEVHYDGSASYKLYRRYNLALIQQEHLGEFYTEGSFGEVTVLTRTREVYFYDSKQEYDGQIQHDTIYKKEVIS